MICHCGLKRNICARIVSSAKKKRIWFYSSPRLRRVDGENWPVIVECPLTGCYESRKYEGGLCGSCSDPENITCVGLECRLDPSRTILVQENTPHQHHTGSTHHPVQAILIKSSADYYNTWTFFRPFQGIQLKRCEANIFGSVDRVTLGRMLHVFYVSGYYN